VKLVIHSIEGSFGRAGAIVVCPASAARVQGRDESRLVISAMGVDELLHPFQMTLLRFNAWLDDGLVAPLAAMLANCKAPNSEAKEVRTCVAFVFVKRVCDAGFAGFEGQSHFSEAMFSQAACGLEHGEVFAQNDKVVCKADDDRPAPFGKACCNTVSRPCRAILARRGEATPPCGVPASNGKTSPFSKMPAFSQPRTRRLIIGMLFSLASKA
jgi:hypothetical protein